MACDIRRHGAVNGICALLRSGPESIRKPGTSDASIDKGGHDRRATIGTGGGLSVERPYLIEGTPAAGKTTLATRFLLEGRDRGKAGLYVTLWQTISKLQSVARSHDWGRDRLDLFELVAGDEFGAANEQ